MVLPSSHVKLRKDADRVKFATCAKGEAISEYEGRLARRNICLVWERTT